MTDLERAFRAWQRARDRHEEARLALADAIRAAVDDGMPQADVARLLGWQRQRVNEVLASR